MWGLFCDRKAPKTASLVGAVLMIFSFLFMGPLPPFGLGKTIPLVSAALVGHGIGLGAQVVAGFADAHHQALASGFPDTVDTYGLISGLWTSVFALGAFIGKLYFWTLFWYFLYTTTHLDNVTDDHRYSLRLLAYFPSVGVGIILTVCFLEKSPFSSKTNL